MVDNGAGLVDGDSSTLVSVMICSEDVMWIGVLASVAAWLRLVVERSVRVDGAVGGGGGGGGDDKSFGGGELS